MLYKVHWALSLWSSGSGGQKKIKSSLIRKRNTTFVLSFVASHLVFNICGCTCQPVDFFPLYTVHVVALKSSVVWKETSGYHIFKFVVSNI